MNVEVATRLQVAISREILSLEVVEAVMMRMKNLMRSQNLVTQQDWQGMKTFSLYLMK